MKEFNLISSDSTTAEYALECIMKWLPIFPGVRFRTTKMSPNLQTIAIGGDGTILSAIRKLDGESPVFGINAGTLGFLSELDFRNDGPTFDGLDSFINGVDTRIEKCNALHYTIRKHYLDKRSAWRTVTKHGTAFNDVVLARDSALDCIKFSVRVNGNRIKDYNADGFVVASPVGASAYALSCGAPLVEPTSKVMVLSPIAPHTLVDRSIVADADDIVSIDVERARNRSVKTIVCIDGQERTELSPGDSIDVITSKKKMSRFIRIGEHNFFDRISRRLGV